MKKFLIGLVVLGFLGISVVGSVHAYDDRWLTTHSTREITVDTECLATEWLLMVDALYHPKRILFSDLLGTSGTNLTLAASTPVLSVYTTSAATAGNFEPALFYTTMSTAGQTGGRVKVYMTTNVALGGWSNALKGEVVYGAAGRTTGLGSAICAEMTLSAGTTSGTYAPLEIELNMGASGVTGTRTSLVFMSVNDAAATTFDDLGYIFTINGLTAGTSGSDAFETGASLDANELTAGLRINIDDVEYYVVLCTPTDIQD